MSSRRRILILLSKSDNKDHPFQPQIQGWMAHNVKTRYESIRSGEMGGRSFKKRQPSRVRGGVRD